MTASNMDLNTPKPFDHVVFTEFDSGEGVLVDLNTKRYYQLNETAMRVWRAIEQRKLRREIVAELTNHYEVTDEHAAASVENILQKFESHKLIEAG